MNIAGKYLPSESVTLHRSEVRMADYNPRVIDPEERKRLKKGIRRYGLLGGLIVNRRTNYTIVQGHQRISIMDELVKYDETTHENDYELRFDVIDVDLKTEKEINALLNNPNAQGRYDRDLLAKMIPDIDWKDAGFTDADLDIMGVDYMLKTEAETDLANQLDAMMAQVNEDHRAELQQRAELRKAAAANFDPTDDDDTDLDLDIDADDEDTADDEPTWDERVQHMRDVKKQVRDRAMQTADDMDAYVMLSFTDFKAKVAFMKRFGYDPREKIIKGEIFDEQVERVG